MKYIDLLTLSLSSMTQRLTSSCLRVCSEEELCSGMRLRKVYSTLAMRGGWDRSQDLEGTGGGEGRGGEGRGVGEEHTARGLVVFRVVERRERERKA